MLWTRGPSYERIYHIFPQLSSGTGGVYAEVTGAHAFLWRFVFGKRLLFYRRTRLGKRRELLCQSLRREIRGESLPAVSISGISMVTRPHSFSVSALSSAMRLPTVCGLHVPSSWRFCTH